VAAAPAAPRAAPPAAARPANGSSPSPASRAPTPGSSSARPPAQTAGRSSTGPAAGSAPGTRAPSGTGPSSSPRPGAAPTPVAGDDWGLGNQNRPGATNPGGRNPGLFNPDGSVRLPGDSAVGGGLPPGTITEDFAKIDRMGTWLKRPPLDYTPTRFDRFWVPQGTLLEEWVRRGIRKVFVPIPGTSKRLVCTVSLLQAGGGCTVDDPNLRDEEATARPPPSVPFKPELQDPGSGLTTPPPAPAPATPPPVPTITP